MLGDLFRRRLTADGYRARCDGRNSIRLVKNGRKFYVFIEWLQTDPPSVAVDTSGVAQDEHFKSNVSDPALRDEVIRNTLDYFRERRIPFET